MNPLTHPYNLDLDPRMIVFVICCLIGWGLMVWIKDKLTMKNKINIIWWMDEKKPVIYNGLICTPISYMLVKENTYLVTLVRIDNGVQFKAEMKLNELKPYEQKDS